VSGVIATWAGPRSSGTAYVMLHHHIGGTDGHAGAWGFPRGGMGGVTRALADAARSFGAELRTDAEVARIRSRAGRVTGVTLASGENIDATTVVTTAHPQISFLRLLDPAVLPAEFVEDIRGWQTRSGTVKINLALDRLPVFASVIAGVESVAPGFTDSILHRQVIGPNQMQQEYGLIGGNIFHGELSLGQMFHARPAAGYADLRTPVRGLYQAGSATHGGGGVTGIPGRNVVRQILADARADRWRARVRGVRATVPQRRSRAA
jgi:phytoene dehydrogenase-like protein